MDALLDIKNLETRFSIRKGFIHAVNGVSLHIHQGETLGIVGESGCGKSVTMLSVMKLLPPAARTINGQIFFKGKDLLKLNNRQMRSIRGSKISMIFQDPMTSLTPVVKIGTQMAEPLIYHKGMTKSQANKRCTELLEMVRIPDPISRLHEYPYQLSGGMRQRVMIAMSLACEPDILIADEPTTALDVTIQAQIIELVKDMQAKLGTSIIWITHDLGVIAGLVNRLVVMYAGSVVEEAPVDDLYEDPRHPYTIGLLGTLLSVSDQEKRRLTSIEGSPPDLISRPDFCPFVPRCDYVIEQCRTEKPTLTPVPEGDDPQHRIACWVDIRNVKSK